MTKVPAKQCRTDEPVAVGNSNLKGQSNSLSLSDHVHAHGVHSDGSHHALAIPDGAAGFLSGQDKAKLDALKVQTPATVTFSTSITLDVSETNLFLVGVLSDDVSVTFENEGVGLNGSIYLQQDENGGHTVTFTPPTTYSIIHDTSASSMAPASTPGAITAYQYTFIALGGSHYLQLKMTHLSE